ncbi:alpha/beta fold hydrolase [Pelagovum sp. HNIBRBA483]|uniref:alpha/beta fold hydrolase n=1 Tax=Pelagovum sp. HNIBRBA483 TaxID=3233341 RepID=UPI0034A29DDF
MMAISQNGTAYELSGPSDAPAVVLIHGLGLTRSSTWGAIVPDLSQNFRVLTYDLLGHGQSALPNVEVTLRSLAKQLVDLMDELKIEKAALLGFSLGGMINRRIAIDFPNRVSALAVLNSPHDRGEEQQQIVEKRAQDTAEGGPAAGIDVTLARWFTKDFMETHAQDVASIRQIVLANDPKNYAAHRWVLAEGVRELIAPDSPINHPTLVLTCENDTGSTPAMTRAITAEIDGAEAIIIPSLQHLGLIERPELFAHALRDFLNRTLTKQ